MTLGNLLSADSILPEMQATERYAAIAELVNLLVERGQIAAADRETVLAALRAREETMSTGIGFGIAIPHASSDRVTKVVAAFGPFRARRESLCVAHVLGSIPALVATRAARRECFGAGMGDPGRLFQHGVGGIRPCRARAAAARDPASALPVARAGGSQFPHGAPRGVADD